MHPHNESAAPIGIGNGAVVQTAVAAQNYQTHIEIASKEYAAAKLTTRFRVHIEMARLIRYLSGLGGAGHG